MGEIGEVQLYPQVEGEVNERVAVTARLIDSISSLRLRRKIYMDRKFKQAVSVRHNGRSARIFSMWVNDDGTFTTRIGHYKYYPSSVTKPLQEQITEDIWRIVDGRWQSGWAFCVDLKTFRRRLKSWRDYANKCEFGPEYQVFR